MEVGEWGDLVWKMCPSFLWGDFVWKMCPSFLSTSHWPEVGHVTAIYAGKRSLVTGPSQKGKQSVEPRAAL